MQEGSNIESNIKESHKEYDLLIIKVIHKK